MGTAVREVEMERSGMKKRLLVMAGVLAMSTAWCGALAQWTTVTASNLQDASRGPLGTTLAPGEVCERPVDQNNHPIAVVAGGGGQVLSRDACAYVVNGAITTAVIGGGTFQSPDTTLTTPANICLRFTFKDAGGVPITAPGYECVQPSGTTFDLDTYTPNSSLTIPTFNGVTGINGISGSFTLTGSGVSCSGHVCTISVSGGCGSHTAATDTSGGSLSGTINGTNETFTLSHTYYGSGSLSYNGYGQGGSYWSVSGTTLTLTFAPQPGDTISFSYCY